MSPSSIDLKMQQAADLIKQASRVVVFTGAGISTPSGIPDFRSQNTGLWSKTDPMQVASMTTFMKNPEIFFNWLRPLAQDIRNAIPNQAHFALASLESAGFLQAVITQNIDGLHQVAGSQNVIELHGSIKTMSCPKCKKTFSNINELYEQIDNYKLPYCFDCRQTLKPDIILFEEVLPQEIWNRAEFYCETADLVLVVGSSLEVMPAGALPRQALRNGAKLMIVNLTSTHLDHFAEVVINDNAVHVLPGIVKRIE